MSQEQRYIDLYGYTKSIIYKDKNLMIFIFSDDYYGDIVCSTNRDTIIYYHADVSKKYHLKAILQGVRKETEGGHVVLNNYLKVKKVYEEQELQTNEGELK